MEAVFKSKKILRVVGEFFKKVELKQSIVIHQIAEDENQQKSFYRLLRNKRMEIKHLKEYIYQDCQRQLEAGKHYLVIQDTTQPNFERNRKNICETAGLGVIGDGKSLGFFLHPSLVIEAEEGRCVGFRDVQTWSREEGGATKKERKYKALPIEEKESMRWLKAHQNAITRLRAAEKITTIAEAGRRHQ